LRGKVAPPIFPAFPIITDDPIASPPGRAKLRGDFFMASASPLMPKATAVWLLDNTALSFDQIADFCKLHPLEVKAIADGDSAQGIKGLDPIVTGQLSREQITNAEANPELRLSLSAPKVPLAGHDRSKKGPRYTPVSRRQDRPNAILWLVRNHPELKDSAIMRLVGTTKSTIASIRDRTHWNSAALSPMDPVTLGLASQIDLDFEVQRAAKDRPHVEVPDSGGTLMPAEVSTAPVRDEPFADMSRPKPVEEDAIDVNSVFAKLKQLKQDDDADAE
jgi:hypothetical protein